MSFDEAGYSDHGTALAGIDVDVMGEPLDPQIGARRIHEHALERFSEVAAVGGDVEAGQRIVVDSPARREDSAGTDPSLPNVAVAFLFTGARTSLGWMSVGTVLARPVHDPNVV